MRKNSVKSFGSYCSRRCSRTVAMRRGLSVVFGRNVRKIPAKTLWVPIPIF